MATDCRRAAGCDLLAAHAAPPGRSHPRARRASNGLWRFRLDPGRRRPGRGLVARPARRRAGRCRCRPATTTSSPTPRSATTSATSGTRRTVRVPARLGGAAGRPALRRGHPPRRRLGGRRRGRRHEGGYTPFEADVTAHVRAGRARSRITVVVDNRLTWHVDPAGHRRGADGRDADVLPRLLQLRRAAPVGLALQHARRRTSRDVTVVTGLDGTTGTVDYRVEVDGAGEVRGRAARRRGRRGRPRRRARPGR